jgi:hypothetical protein
MQVSILADSVVAQSVALKTAVFGLLGVIAVLGLLALLSPKHFAQIANRSSQWVDTSNYFRRLDEPVNVDKHVLRYSRVFGAAVILSAALLCWVFFRYGL